MAAESPYFTITKRNGLVLLRLQSADGTNKLTTACVLDLSEALRVLRREPRPLILTGNQKFFSAGADLSQIVTLTGPQAYEFARMGQELMNLVETFPASVYAAVRGYCMGGGLDLALACHRRVASRYTIFGHRGAALGLMTGWGGTQRLSRLIGKAKALELFAAAEKIHAAEAVRLGLVESVADDPVAEAERQCQETADRHLRGISLLL